MVLFAVLLPSLQPADGGDRPNGHVEKGVSYRPTGYPFKPNKDIR